MFISRSFLLVFISSVLSVLDRLNVCNAFVLPSAFKATNHPCMNLQAFENDNQLSSSSSSAIESLLDDLKMRYRILQESNSVGSSFKQTLANVIAGEYNEAEVKAEVDTLINSAPCVMFTWEKSPSCIKAIDAFDMIGVDYKIIRLDDPWSKGNPMRAELGKKIGRTSVPFIFIDGQYVGGYDGGLDNESAPGIVSMAFQGTLRPKLVEAGALKE